MQGRLESVDTLRSQFSFPLSFDDSVPHHSVMSYVPIYASAVAGVRPMVRVFERCNDFRGIALEIGSGLTGGFRPAVGCSAGRGRQRAQSLIACRSRPARE